MPAAFTDVIVQVVNGQLLAKPGTWIQLKNNATSVLYTSSGAADLNSVVPFGPVPPGIYTVYSGPSQAGPFTITTETGYIVPLTPGDATGNNPSLALFALAVLPAGPFPAPGLAGSPILAGTFNNEWQMPPPNGVDDTAACQAVEDACHNSPLAGGTVRFQPGVYTFTAFVYYEKIRHLGAGAEATIIKLKNGTNSTTTAMLQSANFATLTGTNSTAGVYNFTFEAMTVDGNKANNATMTVPLVRIYGYGFQLGPFLRIRNGNNENLYSEWSTSAATPGFDAMEAHILGLKVHDGGSHGVHWLGPHDSDWSEGESYSNNGRGVFVDSNANATGAGFKCSNVHSWGTNQTAAWYWNAPQCSNANCVGEGASVAQLIVNANDCSWIGGTIFGGIAGLAGVKLGDTGLVNGTSLDTKIVSCTAGAINFNNEGMSLIIANIFQASGVPFIGSPNAGSTVIAPVNGQASQGIFQISAVGPGGFLIQSGAAGTLITGTAADFALQIHDTSAIAGLQLLGSGGQKYIRVNGTTLEVMNSAHAAVIMTLNNLGLLAAAGQIYPGPEALGALQTTGGILHSTGVPSNANGNNNDVALSDKSKWFFKSGGVWFDTRIRQTPTEAVLVSGVDATAGEIISPPALTAARAVGAPLTPVTGQRLTFVILQDGTGGRAVTWNAVFKVSWSDTGNTAGKRSSISFEYDGTNWNQDGAQTPYV